MMMALPSLLRQSLQPITSRLATVSSGKGFVTDLQQHMAEAGTGVVATVIGREVTDMVEGIQSCYDSHTPEHKNTDEFMEPLVDHGNADHALNGDGTPNTAHSTNPVPFIYVTENSNARAQNGVLADVAPTILHIMGLEQPQEMTGQCLVSE